VRARIGIGGLLAALFLPAAPAAGETLRVETDTEDGVRGARIVYFGDERRNGVEIDLAREESVNPDSPTPRKIIGFLVRGAAPSAACEPADSEGEQVCRVPDGTLLLAPRAYGRAGNDSITIYVPRRGAVVFGGPGDDIFFGPYRTDAETQLPGEIYGGPGNDEFNSGGVLYGGPGDDDLSYTAVPSRIRAGPGDDQIWGSDGSDWLAAGPGRDNVLAWGGNDVIRAADGETDTVVCDEGRDSLTADGRDEADFSSATGGPFTDCERLRRRGEPLLSPFGFQVWEQERYVTVLYPCPVDGPSRCVGTCTLRRGGRVIARRRFRERAGEWGIVEFPFGSRRIVRLLDKDIRITMRWRDRTGRMRSLATTDQITEPGEPDDN
jgi:hypothetical protein